MDHIKIKLIQEKTISCDIGVLGRKERLGPKSIIELYCVVQHQAGVYLPQLSYSLEISQWKTAFLDC